MSIYYLPSEQHDLLFSWYGRSLPEQPITVEGNLFQLLKRMRSGDQLILDSFFQLGESFEQMGEMVNLIEKSNIDLVCIDLPSSLEKCPEKNSLLNDILSLLARKGALLDGRSNQVVGYHSPGRPRIPYPENWERDYTLWKNKAISTGEMIKRSGLKKATFYNLVKHYVRNNETILDNEKVSMDTKNNDLKTE